MDRQLYSNDDITYIQLLFTMISDVEKNRASRVGVFDECKKNQKKNRTKVKQTDNSENTDNII